MMQLDARGGDLEDLIVNKHVGSILHTSPEDLSRAAKTVNEKTRLGIPLIIGDDCIHGYSFCRAPLFSRPSSAWLSAGIRTRSRPPAVLPPRRSLVPVYIGRFSPVLCIARDTRWGRVDETFGEDPMLIGELASAMVKGYQAVPRPARPCRRTQFWPAPNISPAIPKPKAAATPPKRTSPTASSNPGFCRRSSAWPKKVAVRSCWVTSPLKACRSHSTNGC